MKKYLLLALINFVSFISLADSWMDPTWNRMLSESDVVAIVEYMSEGAFRAKARIITMYKGSLNPGDQISISSFSNRYGPIDTVHVGDRFLVFIRMNEPNKSGVKWWRDDIKKDPGQKEFADLYFERKAYYVWSPTSGDLKIKSDSVQYDLLQTTYYRNQRYYPLSEFETFLKAYYLPVLRDSFFNILLTKLSSFTENKERVRHLLMLKFLGYDQYNPLIQSYALAASPFLRYAAAQLLGNIHSSESRKLLTNLVEDSIGFVQGEAVRQLEKEPAEYVGPILVASLEKSVPGDYGSGNIMNPVRNTIDGGRTQMIETLGQIGYKDAIPALLPMLNTTDGEEFKKIVSALRKLGTQAYADYINRHLRNLEYDMVLELCFIIDEDSLTQCIPSLMYFVENHDRLKWPTHDVTISQYAGLAKFWGDSTVRNFLLSDFLKLNDVVPSSEQITSKQKWVKSYLEIFSSRNVKEAKPVAYDLMYDYWGMNFAFREKPELFQQKQQKEDSIKRCLQGKIGKGVSDLNVVVYLDVHSGELKDYTVAMELTKEFAEETLAAFKSMNLNESNVILKLEDVTYGSRTQEELSSMLDFLYYFARVADKPDITFLRNLKAYGYARSEYEKERLESFLLLAKNRRKWERKNRT